MLSVFPDLLAYVMIGAAILRLTLGFVFFLHGSRAFRAFNGNYKKEKLQSSLAALQTLTGIFLIGGLFTQVAALVGGVISIMAILFPSDGSRNYNRTLFYILLTGASLSLLFIGPGSFAFDLPL